MERYPQDNDIVRGGQGRDSRATVRDAFALAVLGIAMIALALIFAAVAIFGW